MRIPMSGPDIGDLEVNAVNQVMSTPILSIGPWLERFERTTASFVGTKDATGVSNGTAGLHLCVIAAGLTEGDLCVTTPFSFIASSNCLLYERAVPIFVDIDPVSLNIDTSKVAEAVDQISACAPNCRQLLPPNMRDNPLDKLRSKLKAVLPVHAFGQPADMDPILDASSRYGLTVIEDACEALGAVYKGRKAGTLGDAAVFAFYPNKQMTTGEGGMIVTDNAEWTTLFKSLRNQGRDVFDGWLDHSRLGYNYRLNEISAAIGTVQMRRIEELIGKREHVAELYNEQLRDADGIQIPQIVESTTRMSWFLYVVRLAPQVDRTSVIAYLDERGIPSRVYFSPIHLQPFYRRLFGYKEGDFPITEAVAQSTLALPFSAIMSQDQVDWVCSNLISAVSAAMRKS
jgi:perosamine synthetase